MGIGNMEDGRLFFADTYTFEEDPVAIRGGLLITDMATKPYEFRCTSAVKPTRIQRVMYGKTLDPHVHIELIVVPMIKAAKENPSIIIVRKKLLLGARPFLDVPVVLLEEGENASGFEIVPHEGFRDDTVKAKSIITSKRIQTLEFAPGTKK